MLESDAFTELQDLLHDEYGLHFPEKRLYSLKHKISQRMRETGNDSVEDYLEFVERNRSEEIPLLLDEVSTNRTYFYREPEHWQILEQKLLPTFCERNRFNIWSPACSSGEEPYTAAFCIEDSVRNPSNSFDCQYRILATDLSRSILRSGVQGRYDESSLTYLREHRPEWIEDYFHRTEDEKWQVVEDIRRHVVFREFNLKTERYPFQDTFHLIICRNVLIYFDRGLVENVIKQLTKGLVAGGYLMIGHAESINEIDTNLERVTSSVYRLPES